MRPPASLMHAKFAPDGPQVAYVRENNIYVEDLRDGRITRLTNSQIARRDQRHVRLGLRGGVRPPRRLPLEPRRPIDRLLAARTPRGSASFRSSTTPTRSIPGSPRSSIPRSARRNAACRVGVVSAAGGETAGSRLPGDPRDNYIAYLEWAGNSERARPPAVQPAPEHASTCMRVPNSRRDGQSTHDPRPSTTTPGSTCRTSSAGSSGRRPTSSSGSASATAGGTSTGSAAPAASPTLITPGDFDVIQIVADRPEVGYGLLHRLARQPDAEVPLPRPASTARASSASRPPTSRARTTIRSRPTRRWAIHRFSTFDTPPIIDSGPPARPRTGPSCSRTTRP